MLGAVGSDHYSNNFSFVGKSFNITKTNSNKECSYVSEYCTGLLAFMVLKNSFMRFGYAAPTMTNYIHKQFLLIKTVQRAYFRILWKCHVYMQSLTSTKSSKRKLIFEVYENSELWWTVYTSYGIQPFLSDTPQSTNIKVKTSKMFVVQFQAVVRTGKSYKD